MSDRVGAVIVAAGHGVLEPGVSKLIAHVGGKPMIAHVVQTVLLAGFAPVVLVLNGRFREQIKSVIENASVSMNALSIATQHERRGAAHAVMCAMPVLEQLGCDHFLVVYGDMPCWRVETMLALANMHTSAGASVSMVSVALSGARTPRELERYGRVLRDASGNIIGVVEPGDATQDQLLATRTVNPSLYVFSRQWFSDHFPRIQPYHRPDGHGDELHVPPLLRMASDEHALITELPLIDKTEALGVNNLVDLEDVRQVFYRRIMNTAGVSC